MLIIVNNYQSEKIAILTELAADAANTLLFIDVAVLYLQYDIKTFTAKIYALQESIGFLGIANLISDKIELIDFAKWANLTEQYSKIITL